jgi:peroxiredoxin
MKPVHGVLLLVVLAVCGVGVITKYRHLSTVDEVTDIPEDFQQGGEIVTSIDVTGLMRPDFLLPDISGTARHISEWDGMVIAINFWATWCLPCLKEVPQLVSLQSDYGNKGFQVIGIALQKPQEISDFIQNNNMNYPVLAGEIEVISVAQAYGNQLGALPYTAILNRNGVIMYTKHGAVTREEVEAIILPLL